MPSASVPTGEEPARGPRSAPDPERIAPRGPGRPGRRLPQPLSPPARPHQEAPSARELPPAGRGDAVHLLDPRPPRGPRPHLARRGPCRPPAGPRPLRGAARSPSPLRLRGLAGHSRPVPAPGGGGATQPPDRRPVRPPRRRAGGRDPERRLPPCGTHRKPEGELGQDGGPKGEAAWGPGWRLRRTLKRFLASSVP